MLDPDGRYHRLPVHLGSCSGGSIGYSARGPGASAVGRGVGPGASASTALCVFDAPMEIAILEDDPDQAELMQSWVASSGYTTCVFGDGASFLADVGGSGVHIAVIDWALPDIEGIDVLIRLRRDVGWGLAVLFVTSRDQEEDVVAALEAGADDYMTKPVKRGEFLARVAALARRAQPDAEDTLECDPYLIRLAARRVEVAGREIPLTEREFELAAYLFRHAGQLVTRRSVLEHVWGTSADLKTRTVDTHVSRIRRKLGLGPEVGWRLQPVYQHGYRLERREAPSG